MFFLRMPTDYSQTHDHAEVRNIDKSGSCKRRTAGENIFMARGNLGGSGLRMKQFDNTSICSYIRIMTAATLKSAIVRARIEPNIKTKVENIFETLGLSTSEAISLFFRQVYLLRGIPFDIKIPNKELRNSIEKSRKGIDMNEYDSVDDLFKTLKL